MHIAMHNDKITIISISHSMKTVIISTNSRLITLGPISEYPR